MTPIQLLQSLSRIISEGIKRSVMIWGPPGVGKSSIVLQAAQEADLGWVDLRLSQLAPTDLRGLPVADGAVSKWLPPEFLPRSGKGVLFLDELNMAPPAIQGIAQQLILDRAVGSYRVPDDWFVWAAGNRKEDRAAVFDMPAPLANRFLHFEVEPDFESFRTWAGRRGIHEQILAFLAFRPALLHQPDANHPAWPSCRSWELASELHESGMNVAPAVGAGTEAEFAAFLKIYAGLPDLETILAHGGTGTAFPEEPSMRYAVTIGLGMRANGPDSVGNGFRWLLDHAGPEWCQLYLHIIHDAAVRRNQVGLLATLLAGNPRMSRFLRHLITPGAAHDPGA